MGRHLDILEDRDGEKTIDEVRSDAFAGEWIPNTKENPNYSGTIARWSLR